MMMMMIMMMMMMMMMMILMTMMVMINIHKKLPNNAFRNYQDFEEGSLFLSN